jgi:hypothetical protein
MSVVVTGAGHFQIPTAPSAGTSVTSGAANTFTGTAIVLSASTSAIYITGVHVESSAALAATYVCVQLMQGGSGSETSIGQYNVPLTTGSTVALGFHEISPPIKVANATRLSVKTADSVGSKATLITCECVLQSNVVDDGIAVATVTTVTSQLTAAQIATGVWQDATAGDFTVASSIGKSLYIANIAPGASGGHFISGSNAGTTTFGALTVTGATTHTGNMVLSDGLTISAPSTLNRAGLDIAGNGTGAAFKLTGGATGNGFSIIGGGTSGDGIKVTTTSGHGINLAPVGSSMHGLFSTGGNGGTSDGIKAAAGTGGVDFRANQTGSLTGNISGSVASVVGLTASNLDTTVSSRLAAGSYTAPDNTDIATIVLDTANIKTRLPAALVGGRMDSSVGSNLDKTGYALSVAGVTAIWAEVLEGVYTAKSYMRLMASALLAKLSGAELSAPVFRDTADTKDRITATTDANGNRLVVTLDAT